MSQQEIYTRCDPTGALTIALGQGGRLVSMRLQVGWKRVLAPEYLQLVINHNLGVVRGELMAMTNHESPPPREPEPGLSPIEAENRMWAALDGLRKTLAKPFHEPVRVSNDHHTISMSYAYGILDDLRFVSEHAAAGSAQTFNESIEQIIRKAEELREEEHGTQ